MPSKDMTPMATSGPPADTPPEVLGATPRVATVVALTMSAVVVAGLLLAIGVVVGYALAFRDDVGAGPANGASRPHVSSRSVSASPVQAVRDAAWH